MHLYLKFLRCERADLITCAQREFIGQSDEIPEEILPEIVGSFGKWQLVILIVLSLVMYFHAMCLFLAFFVAPLSIWYRCKGASFDNETCQYRNGTKCGAFEFAPGFGPTANQKFLYVCGTEYLSLISNVSIHLGIAVGCVIFGFFIDRKGRKKGLFISILAQVLLGCCFLAAEIHFTAFIVICFAYGMSAAGAFLSAIIYVAEISSNKWRTLFLGVMMLSLVLAFATLSIVMFLAKEVILVLLVISVPQVLLLTTFPIIDDPPIWLLVRNYFQLAERAIRFAAKCNGIQLSENFSVQPNFVTRIGQRVGRSVTNMFTDERVNMYVLALMGNCFMTGICMGFTSGSAAKHNDRGQWLERLTTNLGILVGATISIAACYILQHRVIIFLSTVIGNVFYLIHNPICSAISYTAYMAAFVGLMNLCPRCYPTDMRGQGFGMSMSMGYVGMCLAKVVFRYAREIHVDACVTICTLVIFVCCLIHFNVERRELPDTLTDSLKFKSNHKPLRYSAGEPSDDEIEVRYLSMAAAQDLANLDSGFKPIYDITSMMSTTQSTSTYSYASTS